MKGEKNKRENGNSGGLQRLPKMRAAAAALKMERKLGFWFFRFRVFFLYVFFFVIFLVEDALYL